MALSLNLSKPSRLRYKGSEKVAISSKCNEGKGLKMRLYIESGYVLDNRVELGMPNMDVQVKPVRLGKARQVVGVLTRPYFVERLSCSHNVQFNL